MRGLLPGLVVLPLASAIYSEEAHLRKSDFAGANALREWTAVMNPHAKIQRQNLLEQAEKRKKSRHLLQVWCLRPCANALGCYQRVTNLHASASANNIMQN